jgi:ADP-dependent NAD(P)H-hydrate dehydratase / NAD(P)H-hydrate epimerase
VKVLNNLQMAELDRQIINEIGIPAMVLMENAARAVVKVLEQKYSELLPKGILIICGTGNNGGDGLAAARYLASSGYPVKAFLAGNKDKIKGEALLNLSIWQKLGYEITEISEESHLEWLYQALQESALIIDAILGTGLSQNVQGLNSQIIAYLNESALPIASVDIPSGIDGSTGKIRGIAVKAQLTITMGALKLGHLLYPGANYTGELWVADIGIPPIFLSNPEFKIKLASMKEVHSWMPIRDNDAHKGSCGKVLIVGGSVGYSGAAALTSEAVLRAGGGLAYLAIPESLNPAMEAKLTEVITLPLPQEPKGCLGKASMEALRPWLEKAEILAIGPGLGREPETLSFCHELFKELKIPAIIDADALMALPETTVLPSNLILTPHKGEMAKILGININEVIESPLEAVLKCARKYQAVTVLKGAHSLIATPEGEVFINPTGNSGMASAGMGDVLTGMIAGLRAQGLSALKATVCGVFWHGLAGNLSAEDLGSQGYLASELLKRLPLSMETLKEGVELFNYPKIIF